jgi:HrpA-like RNA helicase
MPSNTHTQQLLLLGALDVKGELTQAGRQMSHMPLDPPYARALLAAAEHGCVGPMLSLAAIVSVDGALFVGGKLIHLSALAVLYGCQILALAVRYLRRSAPSPAEQAAPRARAAEARRARTAARQRSTRRPTRRARASPRSTATW